MLHNEPHRFGEIISEGKGLNIHVGGHQIPSPFMGLLHTKNLVRACPLQGNVIFICFLILEP